MLLLFYLTTLAAILVAVCRLAFDDPQWTAQALQLSLIQFGILGWIIATVIGFFVASRKSAWLLGAVVGPASGSIAAFIVLIDPIHFTSMSRLVLVGCWLVSMIAIGANRLQNH